MEVSTIKNKLILPAAALTIGTAALFGGDVVHAQDQNTQHATIITRMAQKFGLNENDVKAVFDETRTERQKQMQTKFEDRLTQAVTDVKITEAQKQLIISKKQELMSQGQKDMENWKNMTPQERRQAMQKEREDLKSWATQNNIDLTYFFRGFKYPFGGMRGGWFMKK